jgi:hypothetical protein
MAAVSFDDGELNATEPEVYKSPDAGSEDALRDRGASQRQRMVINSPMIISTKPIRKFQLPSWLSRGILSTAR